MWNLKQMMTTAIPLVFSEWDACVHLFKDNPHRVSASWSLRNTDRHEAANAGILQSEKNDPSS